MTFSFRISAISAVAFCYRRSCTHKGHHSRRWHGWPAISSAVFVVAALAACGPAQATDPSASSAPPAAGESPSVSTHATCVTSAVKGTCGPYTYPGITNSTGNNTIIGQNVWNPISGWAQTLYSTNPGQWHVIAKMPAGNTAVVSFPNVGQEYYYKNTLADFSSIYSSFTENMHPGTGTSAEAAYDIWLNNWSNEVMIQHDIVNRGTCPAQATATFGGRGGVPVQTWHLCKYGSELIWQLSDGERSGRVDILGMLNWLVSHRYLQAESGLTDISYGFEICSTGGRPETFAVSGFSISAAPKLHD
jgi:hypothetical protein